MPRKTPSPNFRLPNGLEVVSLNENDTLTIYRDIFEDDCYRRHGITFSDGDCIVDVGANIGQFVLFLNQLGGEFRVYAFEPAPTTFEVLAQNVELHNNLPIRLFNVGLSNETGRAPFTYYPRFSNASTFHPDETSETAHSHREYALAQIYDTMHPWVRWIGSLTPRFVKQFVADQVRCYYLKGETVTCELRRLSDFLREEGVERIDLLKIDAEQSEERILAGIAEDDWPKIRQVIIEVHDDAATRRIEELLTRRGFRTAVDPNPAMPNLSLVFGVQTTHRPLPSAAAAADLVSSL